MTLSASIWFDAAVLVLFSLIEVLMLGALIGCELLGGACGAWLLPENRVPPSTLGLRLATVGTFLGHVWVGVMTPCFDLALLAPWTDWLDRLTVGMVAASGAFGGVALLLEFLTGLLASRTGLPLRRHESAALKREL